MNNQLFIANKIKVGFQKRGDTFTNMLAYVIYFDAKGKLRKEKSWEGWRDKTIDPQEFENTPQSGFTFNKGVTRGGGDWFGDSVTKIRVWDPRGFEFEISVGNLTQILMHSDVSKRDIVQPCVYAWSGTELILLPTNSTEYEESVKHTAKQSIKFSAKNLTIGHTYGVKVGEDQVVYLGRFDHYGRTDIQGNKLKYSSYNGVKSVLKGKKHVFYNTTRKQIMFNDPSSLIATVLDESVDPKYAEYLDVYYALFESQPLKGFKLEPREKSPYYSHYYHSEDWFKLSETEFVNIDTSYSHTYDWYFKDRNFKSYNTEVAATRVARYDNDQQMLEVSYEPTSSYRDDERHTVEGLSLKDPRIVDLVARIRTRYNELAKQFFEEEKAKYERDPDNYHRNSGGEGDKVIRQQLDSEFEGRAQFKAIMADGKNCSNTPSIY